MTTEPDALSTFREFLSLERDVVVLSIATFAFSLGFQMTSRYLPAERETGGRVSGAYYLCAPRSSSRTPRSAARSTAGARTR